MFLFLSPFTEHTILRVLYIYGEPTDCERCVNIAGVGIKTYDNIICLGPRIISTEVKRLSFNERSTDRIFRNRRSK
jgi:hypothetical protein